MATVYSVHFVPSIPRYGYLAHASGMLALTSDPVTAEKARDGMQRMAERETVPFTDVKLAAVGRFEIRSRER